MTRLKSDNRGISKERKKVLVHFSLDSLPSLVLLVAMHVYCLQRNFAKHFMLVQQWFWIIFCCLHFIVFWTILLVIVIIRILGLLPNGKFLIFSTHVLPPVVRWQMQSFWLVCFHYSLSRKHEQECHRFFWSEKYPQFQIGVRSSGSHPGKECAVLWGKPGITGICVLFCLHINCPLIIFSCFRGLLSLMKHCMWKSLMGDMLSRNSYVSVF